MPIWLAPILSFLGRRSVNFIIYGLAGLMCWGAYQKIFAPTNRTTTNIDKIDKQVNVYQDGKFDVIPIIGCSAYRVKTEVYYQRRPHGENRYNSN